MSANIHTIRRFKTVAILAIAALVLLPYSQTAESSSWNPALLVNTEAFQTIHEGDSTENAELRFGDSLNEKLLWNRDKGSFQFTDDLSVLGTLSGSALRVDGNAEVHGALTASGTIRTDSNITINDDATAANAVLTFGNDGGNETLQFSDTFNEFEFSDDLRVTGVFSGSGNVHLEGNLTGATITGFGLPNGGCSAASSKLLWNTSTSKFECGTDTGGGNWSNTGSLQNSFDSRYVNTAGDNMTGALTISVTGGNNRTIGAEVSNTISGSIVHGNAQLRSSGSLAVEGDASIDGDTLKVDSANGQVGVNSPVFATARALTIGDGTAPAFRLSYNSNQSFYTDFVYNVTGNYYLSIDPHIGGGYGNTVLNPTAGKVGVSTITPGSKLSVSGAVVIGTNIAAAQAQTGTLLEIMGTASGRTIVATDTLASSGSLVVEGNLIFGDALTDTITVNAGSWTFPSATTFTLNDGTGMLEVLGTLSGTNLFATRSLTGAYVHAGSTFGGAGLSSCSNGTTDKLLYNSGSKQFSCGTDQGGGGGITQSAADARYVNTSGDTMTGALVVRYGSGDVLTVSGGVISQSAYGSPATLSGVNLGANARSIYVSGKYAFVGMDSVSGNDLRIFDVHNRAAPTLISGIDVGANVNVIVRVGKMLYAGTSTVAGTCTRGTVTGCEFRIYDISNIASPVAVGGVDTAIGVNDLTVIGELVYITNDVVTGTCTAATGATLTGCELRIYDISNPYSPSPIGGVNDTVDARGVYINGAQAFVVYDSDSGSANELKIFAINNHSNIQTLGGINAGVASLNFNVITVSGKYAYIGTSADASTCSGATVTGCEFRIYDVGNPASPTAVGGLDPGVAVNTLDVAANIVFAGLAASSGTEVKHFDITSPASPVTVGGKELGVNVNAVAIAGKFIYTGTDSQASGSEVFFLDAPGIEAPTATIGSMQTSNLTVTEGARVNNTLFVGNGLNVGRGGVNLRGPLSVQSTSTGSLYTGLDIKNLTGTTMFSVRDDGFADAFRGMTGYNGYMGQEFNEERASATADSTTFGDDGSWTFDVSTTTCTNSVVEGFPTYARSQITAASVGCNVYLGNAAGDPTGYISSTGSLARVLMKVKPGTVSSATQHFWAGLIPGGLAANNVTEPTEGIYFTESGGSIWTATINHTTGVSTYIRCPGATIQTAGYNKFALLEIQVESRARVRFRVDPDMSDGISFINCGYGDPSNVRGVLAPGWVHATFTGFSGTSTLDVDFFRVWSMM